MSDLYFNKYHCSVACACNDCVLSLRLAYRYAWLGIFLRPLAIIALAKVIARKIEVRHLAMAKTCLLVEEMLGILLYIPDLLPQHLLSILGGLLQGRLYGASTS